MLLPLLLLACAGAGPKGDDTSTAAVDDTPPAAPPLLINEILALNQSTNLDEEYDDDDWVELYNPSTEPVSLADLYLSDVGTLAYAPLPASVSVAPRGFLLVWCDGESGVAADTGGGEHVHAPLRLDGTDGESIALVHAPEGVPAVEVDAVQFGPQQPDISAARVPDGSPSWEFGTPTPGASNGGG